MAQPYTLDQFAKMTPLQMDLFYTYYNLEKGQLAELVTRLEQDNLIAKEDLRYFQALKDKAFAEIWSKEPRVIYRLIQQYVVVQPGQSKAEYIRRLVQTGSIEAIKQAIVTGTFVPSSIRTPLQPPSIRTPFQPPSIRTPFQPPSIRTPFQLSPILTPDQYKIPNVSPAPIQVQRIEPLPELLAPSPPASPVAIQPQLELTQMDLSIQAVDLQAVDVPELEQMPQYTITYLELIQVLDDNQFIANYINSLNRIYREKYHFYNRILRQLKAETDDIREEFNTIKRLDPGSKMSELYPQYKTFLLMLTEIQGLIKMIREQLNHGFKMEEIRTGLQNALLDDKEGLMSIIGRENIKNTIAEILYSFSKNHRTFAEMFNNFAIYGPAGVGKTTTAKIIAYVFHEAHLLLKGNLQIVTRADLVSQWIGATAPQTRSILLRSLESVLFIDEAYQLPPPPESTRDHGQEAITEIVNFLDKYIGKNIVIVAGYQREMEIRFMAANEGLPRRFPNLVVLNPYSNEELTMILIKNIRDRSNLLIDNQTGSYIFSLITLINTSVPRAFNNQAGDMLNLASSILRTVESAYQIEWIDGDLENNKRLILSGFNEFLRSKNVQLAFI